jgi:signal transduction histidine kinase
MRPLDDIGENGGLTIDGVRGPEHRVINHFFHDFKGGLSTVLMCIEAVRDGVGGPLNDAQDRWLSRADRNCGHLVELINNFRDMTQMLEGVFPLAPEEVDVARVLSEARRDILPAAQERRQVVELALALSPARIGLRACLFKRIVGSVLPLLQENTVTGGLLRIEAGTQAGRLSCTFGYEGLIYEQRLLDTVFDELEQTRYGLQLGRGYILLFCRTAARYLGGDLSLRPWDGRGNQVELTLPGEEPT